MSSDLGRDELCFMTIIELSRLIETRAISPLELTTAVLDRINKYNDQLNAYITITDHVALDQAQLAESEIGLGQYRGPLHGIPVSLKDNIETRAIRTTCGSMYNPSWLPVEDATVYSKLREAGAVLVGKTNLREYAFPSEVAAFSPPINPWHSRRSAGGSTSGGAVSVATGLGHASIGTDTGGSGRSPAARSAVVGLKATYGRVSRAGVYPLSYSLDHITPMTRTVYDGAIVLQAVSGRDPRDESSAHEMVPNFLGKIGHSIKEMRIGVARDFSSIEVDSEAAMLFHEAVQVLQGLGAQISEIRLPYIEHCAAIYEVIMSAEGAAVHYQSLRDAPERLGDAMIAILDMGNMIPAATYIHAQRVRKVMRDAIRELLGTVDAIIGLSSPGTAGLAGTFTTIVNGKPVADRSVSPEYTGIYNLTGMPALTLPIGFQSEGLPVGMQVAGAWFDEATVFQVAHAYENAAGWHRPRAPYPVSAV